MNDIDIRELMLCLDEQFICWLMRNEYGIEEE